MNRKLCFAGLLLLASCKPVPNTGADGYKFGAKQYERQEVTISVVVYNKRSDIEKAAALRGTKVQNLVAFSTLKPPFDKCTIHMMDPSVTYEPEFVGHEFLHCVYGQWHTNNDSRS